MGTLDVTTVPNSAAVLDQIQTSVQGGTLGLDNWQSFTAGLSGRLTRLGISFAMTAGGTLRIYQGEGTGGQLLGTQSIPPTPLSLVSREYDLISDIQVTSGSTYTFRLTSAANVFWDIASNNPYAGGRMDNPAFDCSFKTYVGQLSPAATTLVVRFGKVGINTLTPEYALDVNGSIRGTLVSPSDARWKKDIQPLPHALDTVTQLEGVSYLWRTDEFPARHFPDDRQMGVIAQQVETVAPSLVSTDADGNKGVNYPLTVPLLIEAIKELKRQNDTLRADHEALRALVQPAATKN
jgi:hypothetical protein